MLFTNSMPIAVGQQEYLSLANVYEHMKLAGSQTLLPFMNVAEKPCYKLILPAFLRDFLIN